ncbi:GspH/FimT family pseudopilin [Gilvimarinus xylanilyticus]|uniref:Type II secretion system protein H n=1 Tax=Gilvimarinus xylanilyticus TaxID=2944139 RepID=A0A9X2I095_9GAMM|nr:GspH/FimT family protein [Gilvimarinus xylanilyticus]MCP8900324.1 GspH/FimT family protein [Gilvimarinus xylanilyticus]
MKPYQGFTLIELIVTLVVLIIVTTVAISSFQTLILSLKVKSSTEELILAAHTARSHAVKENRRITLAHTGQWNDGWIIFVDADHDGERDGGERLLRRHGPLSDSVHVDANSPVSSYISYTGNGTSQWATGSEHSAFQAGTLTVCATEDYPKGYALVLSKGGRIRREVAPEADCPRST